MNVLRDVESINDFLASPIDPELHTLIATRLEELSEYECEASDLVNFFIAAPTDSLADLTAMLGFSPLANRFDGHAYGSAEFSPSWEDLISHEGWYELVYVMSDDGFGFVVFIPKSLAVNQQVLAMCGEHCRPAALPLSEDGT